MEPLLVKIVDNQGADLNIGQQSPIVGHPGESRMVDNSNYTRDIYRPKSIRIHCAALFAQQFQLRRHVHQYCRLCHCAHYRQIVVEFSRAWPIVFLSQGFQLSKRTERTLSSAGHNRQDMTRRRCTSCSASRNNTHMSATW